MPNALKDLRKSRGWTHDEAADAMGISRGQFIKLERGERNLTERTIGLAARAFGVPRAAVIGDGPTPRQVRVIGYVGANSKTTLYDVAEVDLDEAPAPPGATDKTVALEIRGKSLGELFDRWLVLYDDVRRPVTADLVGHLCVVGLEDGRVLVKKVRPAQKRGLFNLISETEPPMLDVALRWAARVISLQPR